MRDAYSLALVIRKTINLITTKSVCTLITAGVVGELGILVGYAQHPLYTQECTVGEILFYVKSVSWRIPYILTKFEWKVWNHPVTDMVAVVAQWSKSRTHGRRVMSSRQVPLKTPCVEGASAHLICRGPNILLLVRCGVCSSGYYGVNCSETCICQNGAKCGNFYGKCLCKPGWKGMICQDRCDPGTYGQDCRKKCDCKNGAACDPVNGGCTCTPGFKGTKFVWRVSFFPSF
ncbi:protein draper [Trichonephila clavipes]|nr:protein draper [Trichonephila clavipes]